MHVISFCRASVLQDHFLDFTLQVSQKMNIAKTEIWGLERPQSFADYSVFIHFPYCDHCCISSMCFYVVLLKILILSSFTSHLIEDGFIVSLL
jgi:hypothetical protein